MVERAQEFAKRKLSVFQESEEHKAMRSPLVRSKDRRRQSVVPEPLRNAGAFLVR